MSTRTLTVLELAPAADELWELDHDSRCGYLYRTPGAVALPDVARGAKLRPRVTAAYASGKATNVARVFDAFLRPEADTPLAREAKQRLGARLVTFLPGQPGGYRVPEIPGPTLAAFTPGGAYLACLQARDFHAVDLDLKALPAGCGEQADRRCANLVAAGGGELANFSPYLLWESGCAEAALREVEKEPEAHAVALAGSLPLVDGEAAPDLYARIVRALRRRMPGALISLDVGGAPLQACQEGGPESAPGVVCINVAEYAAVPAHLWRDYGGIAVVHDRRGSWTLRGDLPEAAELDRRPPDVPVVPDARVVHTICAGDAAHGGLLLGLMLYGTEEPGVHRAAVLSQACALTVVESEDSIRGLTAEGVERNVARVA